MAQLVTVGHWQILADLIHAEAKKAHDELNQASGFHSFNDSEFKDYVLRRKKYYSQVAEASLKLFGKEGGLAKLIHILESKPQTSYQQEQAK